MRETLSQMRNDIKGMSTCLSALDKTIEHLIKVHDEPYTFNMTEFKLTLLFFTKSLHGFADNFENFQERARKLAEGNFNE